MHTRLVFLTALIITAFISLPRLLVWEVNWIDFSVRSLYVFVIAGTFIFINLRKRRILISLVLFVIIDAVLIRLHLIYYDPPAGKRLFKALFNANMAIAFTMSILLCEIFRLIYRNTETRYEVLRNQVNPHFLFNSFNTINSLIMTDQQAAVNFVNNMSDVFRYVLKSSQVKSITVEEELQFIDAYINMLKGRHGNKLQVHINIPHVQHLYRLPPMALQLLVENAVKHNIVSNAKPLQVQITGHEQALTVCNNLQKRKTTEPSTGVGLDNLNQRCKYLSKRALIIRQTNDQFAVTIPLQT